MPDYLADFASKTACDLSDPFFLFFMKIQDIVLHGGTMSQVQAAVLETREKLLKER